MPGHQKTVPPAERERFRRWLSKLSACVEEALDNPGDVEAAAELRAMILAALAAVGSMDRRAQMTLDRRERQLRKAIDTINGVKNIPAECSERRSSKSGS